MFGIKLFTQLLPHFHDKFIMDFGHLLMIFIQDYLPNINSNNVFYIVSGTVAAINISILVFTVSVIDFIATKSNVVKRV